MIQSILWDFDGVIAESVNVKGEVFRELYLKYGNDVANRVLSHHMDHGGVSRYEKFKFWHKEFLGIDLSQEEILELARAFSSLVIDKVVRSPRVEGVESFLKTYSNKYDFYIVSATPDNEIKQIADKMDLTHYFRDVLGSPTSKTQWINKLVSENKIQINTSLFIGDSTSDYNAALNSNMKFILRDVEYNRKAFSDFKGVRVSDFRDFENVVQGL